MQEEKLCSNCDTIKPIEDFQRYKKKRTPTLKPNTGKYCNICTDKIEYARRKQFRINGFNELGTSCHNNLKKYLL